MVVPKQYLFAITLPKMLVGVTLRLNILEQVLVLTPGQLRVKFGISASKIRRVMFK